tara:strand:+ start:20009 stop:22156 length:2148 start_codon:yes stop_codon:yes gene_type:complete
MAYQQRLYKLVNIDSKQELVLDGTGTNNEPKNWEDSERTIKKSTKNFSITTELSKKLEFTGAGARFLIDAYNLMSIEARVKMYEYRFNPKTDVPYIYSVGDFNFSKYSSEKNIVNIPFESGTLTALVKAKQNDKFELNRTESIDGVTIPPLVVNEFAGVNRSLDLQSLSETSEDERNLDQLKVIQFETQRTINIPLSVVYESDDSFVSSLANQKSEDLNSGLAAACFYYISDRDKIVSLNIKYSSFVKIKTISGAQYISLDLVIYEGGDSLNVKNKIPLKRYVNINDFSRTEFVSETYLNNSFNILKDESLSLEWSILKPNLAAAAFLDVNNLECSVNIKEQSERNDINRRVKCVRNNEVGRTLMGLINGDKDTYKSEFFESSEFKNTAITTGKLIRGFEDLDITTSLKEFLDNSNSLFNMGYNVEVINGKETLVHEPLRHFFRSQTIIEIKEQVNKVKRTPALEFAYSTIKSGYRKPSGDNLYEEVNGLNEFNTINEYTTPITREVKDYSIESPYRADSEGKELTYRQNIVENPTSDYRTDKTIFNLDLKESGTSVFEERTWQDDYEEAPKNVFSPDTVTGLRITPFRNMSRHFWFLNSAFTKFTDKYIRYSNTRGNSELITKKVGEEQKKENGNYQINTLENAIFVNEWIEFEYPLTFDLLEQINGFTDVNDRNIPNTYFKISFINEFNRKEYGYLFDLKPNKQGKWKLLKAI